MNKIILSEYIIKNCVSKCLHEFINEKKELLNEYFDKHLVDLRNYFNKTPHEKNLFIISNGGWYDSIKNGLKYCLNNNYFEDANDEIITYGLKCCDNYRLDNLAKALHNCPRFTKWLVDYIKSANGRNYVPCSFEKMDYIRDVKNEWLIHFTHSSEDIRKEGFTKGVYSDWDYRNMLLATLFLRNEYEEEEGYNFAYSLKGNDYLNTASNLDNYYYGKECVIFQASGVEIYHQGDKDKQVIFWGPSAKNIISIKQEDGNWYIKSIKTNRKLIISKNQELPLKNVISWCIKNIQQYRKQLGLSL